MKKHLTATREQAIIVSYDTIWGDIMDFSEKTMTMLCKHPIFSGIAPNDLYHRLSRAGCSVKHYSSGAIILSPQTDEKMIGMILTGKAVVMTPDSGKSVLLRCLDKGDLFGIASFFIKESYVSLIRATTSCKIFCIPESAIRELLESDRDFLYRYLEFLSGRICYLNKKIGYLTAGSAERRLARYLSSFEEDSFILPLSLSALSEVLDIGRASLYRSVECLTADGFIKKEGRKFTILNREAMLAAYD